MKSPANLLKQNVVRRNRESSGNSIITYLLIKKVRIRAHSLMTISKSMLLILVLIQVNSIHVLMAVSMRIK